MEMDTIIIWGIAIGLFALLGIPFLLRKRRLEHHTEEADLEALKYGLKEPVTLHPVVNPDECIGSANCIAVCPEKDVLGLRNGQAIAVSPARCVGHGLCERSCPVDAIQLVFGSEKRGVDIPRIRANFETNVPGVYIIGELGGMGLIRNAFEQGRQCVESISREKQVRGGKGVYDVVIVGCGPAGLSAALHCRNKELDYLVLEKEDIGGAVRSYPRKKLVMTSPLQIPDYGTIRKHEIVKEELIELWLNIVEKLELNIQEGKTVNHIHPAGGEKDGFEVKCGEESYRARRVIVAIGRRGTPRKLGIEGEELSNVFYSLREPDQFSGNAITVVGGGDSAVEAALSLAEQPGNEVRISYRRDKFSRIKPGNQERIDRALAEGRLEVLWNTNVVKNTRETIDIEFGDGHTETLENDYLFIFAGGVLPTAFMQRVGIKIDTKFGDPVR